MANRVGRPLKFKTPEILEKKIQEYFESCLEEVWEDRIKRDKDGNELFKEYTTTDKKGNKTKHKGEPIIEHIKVKKVKIPYTITGLAVALDTDRQTLLEYEGKVGDRVKGKTEKETIRFADAIKKAKVFIEHFTEERLFGNNVTGVIFNLKNNYGWKDVQEIENKNPMVVNVDINKTIEKIYGNGSDGNPNKRS